MCWRVPAAVGRMRLIDLIEQAAVVHRILRHLGVPSDIPEPRPARAPPVPTEDPDMHRSTRRSCVRSARPDNAPPPFTSFWTYNPR
jgi:hypothetical protein